jgi:hypothetical protein
MTPYTGGANFFPKVPNNFYLPGKVTNTKSWLQLSSTQNNTNKHSSATSSDWEPAALPWLLSRPSASTNSSLNVEKIHEDLECEQKQIDTDDEETQMKGHSNLRHRRRYPS